jgi:hypothetical protein
MAIARAGHASTANSTPAEHAEQAALSAFRPRAKVEGADRRAQTRQDSLPERSKALESGAEQASQSRLVFQAADAHTPTSVPNCTVSRPIAPKKPGAMLNPRFPSDF